VWLGARRNAVEEIYGISESQKQERKRETQVKVGLEGPLAVGSVQAGGGRSSGQTSGREGDANIKKSLSSVMVTGGDENLLEK
jgi:hypothetical protein